MRFPSAPSFLPAILEVTLLTSFFRFRQRFKSMIDQYELRELHFHSLMRTKELEVQYNMARFERERKRAEAEVALSQRLNEQVQELSRSEAKMQAEMKLILEKIEQAGLPP